MTGPRIVPVRTDDLEQLMRFAAAAPLSDEGEVELRLLLARCAEVLAGEIKDGTEGEAALICPPGEYARVELPGYVSWTGWVAEETFAGAGVLVVRDISGIVKARVSAGAFRQVIPLSLPRPGETAVATAIEAGGETWADDEDGGYAP